MSEREQGQTEQAGGTASGTAVKALAAAAATGAATYAVRKALASRDGHNHSDEEEAVTSEPEDGEEEAEDEWREDDEGEYQPESSAGEGDEENNEDEPEARTGRGSDHSRRKGSLRQLVNPSTLATASQLLLPVAGQAADSAGRYVAEHAPDPVREQLVPRFIKAFEKAS